MPEYSANVPSPEEQDVRAKLSPDQLQSMDQSALEQKLAEKPFFAFVQKIAEKQNVDIQKYLTDNTPEKVLQLAERYDKVVRPTVDRFKKFAGDQFLGKMKALPPEAIAKAGESIEAFMSQEAAQEAVKGAANLESFSAKYSALLDQYEHLANMAGQLNRELSAKYGTTNKGELSAIKAQAELMSASAKTQGVENTTIHAGERTKIAQRRLNSVARFFKTIRTLGKERRSDAEIAEDEKFSDAQEPLQTKITSFEEASLDIGLKIPAREDYDKQIGDVREQILAGLSDANKLRDILLEATMDVVTSGKYNIEDAASSVNELGDEWGDQNDAEFNDYIKQMIEQTYQAAVKRGVEATTENINPNKIEEFNRFVVDNVRSNESKQLITDTVQQSIDAESDKRSPKVAQLTLMLNRVNNLKFS